MVLAGLILSKASLWLIDGRLLPVSLHDLYSVWDCVLISSSYNETSHSGLGPTHMISFYLNYPFKDSVSKCSNILTS